MERATRSTTTAVLLLAALLSLAASEPTASAAAPTDFIRTSCRSTLYPALCVQCLSPYAPVVRHSPRHLANAALTVSSERARAASTFVSRMSAGPKPARAKDGGAVRDCMETLNDSFDRLRGSIGELGRLGRAGSERFAWHLSNAQTWVSAALTDENTCLESLSEDASASGVRAAIRSKIVDVAHVTSNALALVNRIGARN